MTSVTSISVSPLLLKVWRRNFKVWTKFVAVSTIGNIGEPILYLLAIGMGLGQFVPDFDSTPYIKFLAPAVLMISVLYNSAFETTYATFTRMKIQKTFQSIAVTPISISEVIMGEMLWASTKCVFSAIPIILVFIFFGLLPLDISKIAILLLLSILAGACFSTIGTLYTSFVNGYDHFAYFFTLFISPMFLFSGTFFPLSALPKWASSLAWFLPLKHAVDPCRGIFLGAWENVFWLDIIWLLVVTMAVGYYAVKRMVGRLVV